MSSSAFLESIWGCICGSFLPSWHCLSHWITFMAQWFPVGDCGGQHWPGGICSVPVLVVSSLSDKGD